MLKQRKQIRLRKYDYSKSGYYYVTVCTQNRECIFGNIVINIVGARRNAPKIMKLNEYGLIVNNVLESLSKHHPVELDTYQIMPNHIHMIVIILDVSGRSRPTPTHKYSYKPTLGFIVGILKTECTSQINKLRNTPGQKLFQRNYYEHIVRNEIELFKIREYIKNNPLFWNNDINYA
ncbi:transposase [Candidatus Roizmanbacteria bacterium CG02_land_8_20_14_3_00_36_15]|uniref:Transposase n=2 Tax=Candidatus Roizmaniibacteriota TaxID=1752723 RepID=A0A2M8KL63_9BACT|nr:MAG: transposase [Candidatus Roizmanbacteria bacterium CG03_land_8_20_14_0_80_36_21]PIV37763.1 MAG: transposase [Candidatus Roizmanbacteria bacterium CG02_land_8_20_14_3_00_36_15]PIY69567.1 MAG: transposase [Candidatus Roizmanbacteria bacterium CG_4_10_14_0_8_um_filter_36_36]PJA52907.1 MAG: transposase [Candidatus Roizmanbacteria bacterium CG_4_9_14_3_um_filter_36_11]PJC82298.1 MAG: transposase [Candidatus Roizmanbacteria bacterium CG_4_8_14_3_um_filter_36_10]PJE60630.1 MAG: transposase [Ca